MRYLLLAAIVTVAACRGPAGSDGSVECDTTLDCPEDEVCAVGHCHDMGCGSRYTVICCTPSGWGSICRGQPVRPGGGFTPAWTAEYPDDPPDVAWAENYEGIECLFHRCDMM